MGPQQPRHACSGNVLFLILIAVALFAALSYAVTQSSRSGGGDASKETVQMNISRMTNFIVALRGGITRITLPGVEMWQVQYDNNVYRTQSNAAYYPALGNPADPTRYLFVSGGGNVSPQTFEDISIPCVACSPGWAKPGHLSVRWVSLPGIGTTASDAVIQIHYVSKAACEQFNAANGITGTPDVLLQSIWLPTSGQTSPVVTPANSGSGLSAIRGKDEFCITSMGDYHIYATLKVY